jgi:hypothetical protein
LFDIGKQGKVHSPKETRAQRNTKKQKNTQRRHKGAVGRIGRMGMELNFSGETMDFIYGKSLQDFIYGKSLYGDPRRNSCAFKVDSVVEHV